VRIRRTHSLLLFGAAGPIAFVAISQLDAALQPDYSSWHDTISTLSLAPHGWIQIVNFILYGVLMLCFTEGLRRSGEMRTLAYVLLVTAAAGLIIIGPFRTDPVLGFPPGEPTVVTPIGTVHNMGALLVFLTLPAAAVATLRRPLGGWAAFSTACSVLSLAAIAAFFATITAANGHDGGDSPAGLFERLPALIMGLWQIAYALRVLTGRDKAGHRGPSR
jgi:hypothetical membrane protein